MCLLPRGDGCELRWYGVQNRRTLLRGMRKFLQDHKSGFCDAAEIKSPVEALKHIDPKLRGTYEPGIFSDGFQMFLLVDEFHRLFGVGRPIESGFPDTETRELRTRLIIEEYDELFDAIAADDEVEVADALADITYLACGTAVAYGIIPRGVSVPYYQMPVKGRAMRPSEVDFLLALDTLDNVTAAISAMKIAETLDNLHAVAAALNQIISSCFFMAAVHNIDLNACFNEVHASNMTKLGPGNVPIYRPDGKIMKGPDYRRPDIRRVLAEQVATTSS